MTLLTPYNCLEMERCRRLRSFKIRNADGIVVSASKWIWGCPAWHWQVDWFIRFQFFLTGVTNVPMRQREARATFEKAVELNWFSWTVIVVALYVMASWASGGGPLDRRNDGVIEAAIVLWLSAAICAFRIGEIISTSIQLHLIEHYETDKPAHALLLTFLAFFQVIVCFAVLYWLEAVAMGDAYGDCPLWSSNINALYLSGVTMTTLGYGDFSPQHWCGKSIVLTQVSVGLLLLVVAFQRVLGGPTTAR